VKLSGLFSIEGHCTRLQFWLTTMLTLLVYAGLIALITVNILFLLLVIPGCILMAIIFCVTLIKRLSEIEDKEGKLSALWFWDQSKKREDDDVDEPVIDYRKQRQIEEIKKARDSWQINKKQ
jgi:hypothetical protein